MTLSKSPRAAHSRARGFSLIELIVAIAVFAIGIMAVITMLAFNIKSNTYSKSMGMANYVAERHLEKIRSWPVYETTVVDGVTRLGINDCLSNPNTDLFGTFLYDMTGSGNTRTFELTSELYQNGVTQDCQGVLFGASGGSRNVNDGDLNTKEIKGYCNTGFRGEDFKLVRVKVVWRDPHFHKTHTIERHEYIAEF